VGCSHCSQCPLHATIPEAADLNTALPIALGLVLGALLCYCCDVTLTPPRPPRRSDCKGTSISTHKKFTALAKLTNVGQRLSNHSQQSTSLGFLTGSAAAHPDADGILLLLLTLHQSCLLRRLCSTLFNNCPKKLPQATAPSNSQLHKTPTKPHAHSVQSLNPGSTVQLLTTAAAVGMYPMIILAQRPPCAACVLCCWPPVPQQSETAGTPAACSTTRA
jgi:hypothetical protein